MKVQKITLIGLGLIPSCGFSSETGSGQDQNGSQRPNIIFCIADDASYPHFSAYGCKWISTPGFDRIAKSGILFTNAYTPNAKSAPSRACILTGRYSWQLEEAANHISNFPAKFKTFMENLRENSYFVGYTAKGWEPGNPGIIDGKARELTGIGFNKRKTKPPSTGINNNEYSANFNDFLDQKPKNTPWCFWYGGREPHRAYQYGSGISLGGKNIDQIEKVPGFWPDNDTVRNDILDYGRPMNQGYPIRSIIKDGYLFQINFKPDLWPAGNPETGYLNTDGSPTKTFILNLRRKGIDWSFWEKCFGKHPEEELYNINADPECLLNLAGDSAYLKMKEELKKILVSELNQQDDPRIKGNGDVFDNYPFDNHIDWSYYERYMKGEIKKYQTDLVKPGDYETQIIVK